MKIDFSSLTRKCGIYCFTNDVTKHRYIGKAKNIRRRTTDHLNSLKKGKDKAIGLQEAWDEYGEDSFSFKVIMLCDEKELDKNEIFYIKKYKTNNPLFGYNKTLGGNGGKGYLWTDKQKNNVSGENHHNYKKPMSEEQKDKIRKTRIERKIGVGKDNPHYGKNLSKEHVKKIAENHADVSGIKNPRFGKKLENASSKYFGVSWFNPRKTWRVTIHIDGKHIDIGTTKIEIDAARIYDQYVIKNKLSKPLNFP